MKNSNLVKGKNYEIIGISPQKRYIHFFPAPFSSLPYFFIHRLKTSFLKGKVVKLLSFDHQDPDGYIVGCRFAIEGQDKIEFYRGRKKCVAKLKKGSPIVISLRSTNYMLSTQYYFLDPYLYGSKTVNRIKLREV